MGIGEAQLIETVKASGILSGYEWGNMARPDGVFLSIELQNPKNPEPETARLNTSLGTLLGKAVYGYNDDTLVSVVQMLALSQGVTLSCAESCTGGYFGKAVTDMAGSSAYFTGGIIAYSNTVKTSVLNVSHDLLKTHGAVSVQCAEAMAHGCQTLFQSGYAVSITGIAGPARGTPEKPVGTVCFGIATPDATVLTYTRLFFGNRDDIRKKSVYHSLNYLRLAMMP
jgi:nicotinamide-nucleotide amidase